MRITRSHIASAAKLALGGLVLGSLLGCNATSRLSALDDNQDSFTQAISSHEAAMSYNQREDIGPQLAVVQLRDRPHGILSATQRNYSNGFSQRIVYPVSNDVWGENFIEIRVTGSRTKRKPDEKLTLHSSRLAVIQSEAQKALGDRSISLADENFLKNAYGPFGLIYNKRKGNIGCLFGWQTLLNENSKRGHSSSSVESAGWPAREGLSYRIRYCAKDLSLAQARDVMERVYLAPGFGRIWFDGAEEEQTDPINTASILKKPNDIKREIASPVRSPRPAKPATNLAAQKTDSVFVPLPASEPDVAKATLSTAPIVPLPSVQATRGRLSVVETPELETHEDTGAILVPLP